MNLCCSVGIPMVVLIASAGMYSILGNSIKSLNNKIDSNHLKLSNMCRSMAVPHGNESNYSIVNYRPTKTPEYFYQICTFDILIRAIEYNPMLFMNHLNAINNSVKIFSDHELECLYDDICIYGYENIDTLIQKYFLSRFKHCEHIRMRFKSTLKDLYEVIDVNNALITNYVRNKVKVWLKFHESVVIAAKLNKKEITDFINKMTLSIQVMKIIAKITET